MSYKREFRDFDYELPELEGYTDNSWHNDVCPCLVRADGAFKIWCDYADPARRELPTAARYTVCIHDGEESYSDVLRTESWPDVLNYVDPHIEATQGRKAIAYCLAVIAPILLIVGVCLPLVVYLPWKDLLVALGVTMLFFFCAGILLLMFTLSIMLLIHTAARIGGIRSNSGYTYIIPHGPARGFLVRRPFR